MHKTLLDALTDGMLQVELTTWCVMYLVRNGYVVEQPGKWEKPYEFCARLGISDRSFRRHLGSKFRPQVDLEMGPRGRINRLRSNSAFDSFMRRHQRGSGQKSRRNGHVAARK